ncbi:MAG: 4-(cytidine 5'-diphospho)-2-C-methyl-D-erythritol kinase, partial [Candidatus Omnitrophica bacterium]|nr:4-(cytidine 5'-diphospho)-2-C-methyl-D-erythritol kinase [Candidatus Omnitrophota bacterium]
RDNLAYKAAEVLFEKTGFKKGVWIDIKKNIPIAAGLGGGSSNAASVLVGVNRLFKLGLKRDELIEIGKILGADVPFFLYDYNFAIGRERGDAIMPIINKLFRIWHIIIAFRFGLSTKDGYGNLNLKLTPDVIDVKMLRHFILKNDIENLAVCLYNKLEETVLSRVRIIGRAKTLLFKNGAYGAVLSGSGPTIVGITKTREEAIAVKRRISRIIEAGCKIFVVKTFN